jgi:tRNA (guanine37-N1)-methyltransferase
MKADIVTIFPDFFRGPLDHGITRRACQMGLAKIEVHDLRQFTRDRHRTVDDRPFGGGEGMVLKPEPIFECLAAMQLAPREERIARSALQSVILLSPQGRRFNQATAAELAALERLVLLCGRYEGVDERVADFLADREISIGDYVLSGGELGAAVIMEAVARLLPGAVGNEASTRQESFSVHPAGGNPSGPDSTCASGGLLDYPHYTRPAEFRGIAVPPVLLNGNHEEIRRWRREQALKKTLRNRPDLLAGVSLSEEDRRILERLKRSSSLSPSSEAAGSLHSDKECTDSSLPGMTNVEESTN